MSENPIFSYTKRDYEGSRKEGLAKIPIISKGNWTDLNPSDPGIVILDYVHALVDMLSYYQDHQALESFITTAKERANIFRLAKQLSYKIRSSKGATCEVEFTRTTIDKYVKIPRYTSVSTLSGINYLTSEDAYLSPGESRVSVPCIQGKLNIITYKGTGISRYSEVSGAADQKVRIADRNVDIESISIVEKVDGVVVREWSPVDYITFSSSKDRVYQLDYNPDDSVTIIFGDGERGVVPQPEDELEITYITNSAEEGRVGMNSLTVLNDTIEDEEKSNVEFTVNNNKASTGGSSSQSSQEIRELAPGALKAQDRAITITDFENLARLVEGVADAKAYDINTKPDRCLHHEVKVFITPANSSDNLDLLKRRVNDYLSSRMIPPTNLEVLTPVYEPLDIVITLLKMDNISESRIKYNVQQVVTSYFLGREGAIDEAFYPSDLAAIIRSVEGVRTVVSITPKDVVTVSEEFSVLKLRNLEIEITN